MAIYKRGQGVELGSTVKQFQLVVRAGLEPATSEFQNRPGFVATFKNVTWTNPVQKSCASIK